MKKTIYILFLFCMASLPLLAQDVTVSGIVTGANTNDPLPGVTVQVKGKAIGTSTDIGGRYSIHVSQGEVLVFSQVGMYNQEVIVSSEGTINIALSEDDVLLEQVVVIGYGSMKKSHLSGAVSSMSSEKMGAEMFTSLGSALQGKVPGVSVGASDGNPASGPSIVIRGVNSLVNNSPLYIIDGSIGDLSMISTNDILSLEVLKDASAAAIYGSRAAAGVVLITTKSGKRDMPTKLDLNISTGFSTVTKKPQMLNANQWSQFAHLYGLSADGYGGSRDENGFFNEPIFEGKGTNWQDVVFRTAMTYNLGATISGGSKTASYSTSFTYLDQEGIMRTTDNQTYNLRLKSDYSFLNDRLKIGQTFIMRNARNNGSSDSGTIFAIREAVPTLAVYDPENMGGWGSTQNVKSSNPLAVLNIYQNQGRHTNIFFNAFAELRLIDQLKYKVNIGLRKNKSTSRNYRGAYEMGVWGSSDNAELSQSASESDIWVLENTLFYDRKFGDHSINLLAGYSAQKDRMRSLNGKNTDMNPLISTMPGVGTQTASSSLSERSLLSMFGRVMYSFDDRYLFSASVRRDGSSRFSDGHRFGTFPSVSAGWNIHEENFAEAIKPVFHQLKLRVSYGELGNESVSGYYPTQSGVGQGLYYSQGTSTWYGQLPFVSAVSPQNLTWETTKSYNIGLDLGFFGGKLAISADAFIKKTEDVLLLIATSPSEGLGGGSSWQNAGRIDNKGVEVNIDYNNSVGDINYYAGVNFSSMTNKVKSVRVNGADVNSKIGGFGANGHAEAGVNVFTTGQPMVSYNLLKSDGIFQSMDEVKNHVNSEGVMIQSTAKPGDQRFVDYNKDGRIDDKDLHAVGSVFPDLDFGIRLGADWKGFDINMFFDGMLGNDLYNYSAFRTESGIIPDLNYGYKVSKSWREDNRDTNVPRFAPTETGHLNGVAYSDRWLEDASYFRLKNLNIGYTLPKDWLKKVSLGNIRVYASFENLFTITGYSGYTPDMGMSSETPTSYEVLSYGVDHGRYPVPRTISFGVQIGL